MHIGAPEVGFVTATGVVAGNIPLALGAAFASAHTGDGAVGGRGFGDGAGQTGSFHESLNIASLWGLPVVFVCENNGYAEFSPLSAHTKVERLARHAETLRHPGVTVDGNDVLAVRARGREGGRARPCRWRPDLHRGPDLPAAGPLRGRPGASTGSCPSWPTGRRRTRSPGSSRSASGL